MMKYYKFIKIIRSICTDRKSSQDKLFRLTKTQDTEQHHTIRVIPFLQQVMKETKRSSNCMINIYLYWIPSVCPSNPPSILLSGQGG